MSNARRITFVFCITVFAVATFVSSAFAAQDVHSFVYGGYSRKFTSTLIGYKASSTVGQVVATSKSEWRQPSPFVWATWRIPEIATYGKVTNPAGSAKGAWEYVYNAYVGASPVSISGGTGTWRMNSTHTYYYGSTHYTVNLSGSFS